MSVFVTGTDTGVGKTVFTVWLLKRLRERGVRCAGYKPICCGDRHDADLLLAASSPGLTIDEVNPVWLRTPAIATKRATSHRPRTPQFCDAACVCRSPNDSPPRVASLRLRCNKYWRKSAA